MNDFPSIYEIWAEKNFEEFLYFVSVQHQKSAKKHLRKYYRVDVRIYA